MSAVIDLMSSDGEENEMPAIKKTKKDKIPTTPVAAAETTKNEVPQPVTAAAALATEPTDNELNPALDNAVAEDPQTKAKQNQTTDSNICKTNTENVEPEKSTPTAVLTDQRARRRKSQHQTVRTSPEIEFESLLPAKKLATESKHSLGKVCAPIKKTIAKKISILAPKPLTCEQMLDIEFEKLLKQQTTLNLLREIAAERVRINQMLSLNSMPEINFSLYTKREMLEFQLVERFKQKEIRMKSLGETKRV